MNDADRIARFEAAVAAFNEQGVEAFLERATQDFHLATAAGFPGGGSFDGLGVVSQWLTEFVSHWAEVRYEYEDVRVENGAVLHLSRWVVRAEGSDDEASAEVFGCVRFRGELMSALDLFWTEEEAHRHAEMTA
jgi:hypothetical protein